MRESKPILNKSDIELIVDIASNTVRKRLSIPSIKFFLGNTEEVAKNLLGSYLLRVEGSGENLKICGGKIVEVEAYLDKTDPASHAATMKITKRNRVFYEEGGLAYVFHARANYYCFNVIVRPTGLAGCVLVRALEPLFGIETMAKRRSRLKEQIFDLCSGPSKLCQSLGINTSFTGYDLRQSELLILNSKEMITQNISSGPRIGITKAKDWELRFWEEDSEYISRKIKPA